MTQPTKVTPEMERTNQLCSENEKVTETVYYIIKFSIFSDKSVRQMQIFIPLKKLQHGAFSIVKL